MDQLAPYALTTTEKLMKLLPELDENDAAFLINVASELVKKELGGRSLGFAIVPTSAPLLIPGTGDLELFLPRWPIRSVEQILENGSPVTDYVILQPESGDPEDKKCLYRTAGWSVYAQCSGRLVRDPDPRLVERSLAIAFTAGYILPPWDGIPDATNNPTGAASDLPYRFQQATLWACQDWVERPTPGLMGERTPGGWSQQWQMAEPPVLSARAKGLLGTDGGFWF